MALTKRMALVGASIGAFLMVNGIALAQGVTLCDPLGTNCKSTETVGSVLANVTTFLQYIGAPIAVIMVLVGAFQMMTSEGNPEKYTKGKDTLIWAAVGFAIVLLAGGITTLISNILNGQ